MSAKSALSNNKSTCMSRNYQYSIFISRFHMSRNAFHTYDIYMSALQRHCIVFMHPANLAMPDLAAHRNLAMGPNLPYHHPLCKPTRVGETGAGCSIFYQIDHSDLIFHERLWSKWISSERVICQPHFHLGLELNVHVGLEQYHLEV